MKTKYLFFYCLLIFATSFCFSEEEKAKTSPIAVTENTSTSDSLTSTNISPVDLSSLASPQTKEELDIPEIAPIRPAVKLPTDLWKILTLVIVIILIIFGIIAWLLKKYKDQKLLPIIPVDPYQQALKALNAAFQQIQLLDQRPFAFGITDAIRQYLSSVFNLPAPECTTDEVLEKLPSIDKLPKNLQEEIIHLLQQCDLAKFTKQTFEHAQRLEIYNLALNILNSADKIIQLPTEETKNSQ